MSKIFKINKQKITIRNRIRLDIEVYILDMYAFARYKLPYEECKIEVNKDLLETSEKYKVDKIADIRFLLQVSYCRNIKQKEIIKKYINL